MNTLAGSMHRTQARTALLAAGTLLIAAATLGNNAYASGSFGSSFGSSFQNSYNQGKAVYLKKVICSTCPLADLPAGKEGAAIAYDRLRNDKALKKLIRSGERRSARRYLKKRYKL